MKKKDDEKTMRDKELAEILNMVFPKGNLTSATLTDDEWKEVVPEKTNEK